MTQCILTSLPPIKANILIGNDRRARVADFGLSTITGVKTLVTPGASRTSLISGDTLMSFTGGGTRRWMSPELLYPERFGMPESENNRPTRQSDCYALGMVIYEVGVSRRVPLFLWTANRRHPRSCAGTTPSSRSSRTS